MNETNVFHDTTRLPSRPRVASHADVLSGSSRVPARLRGRLVLELKFTENFPKNIQKIGTGTKTVVAFTDIFLTKIDPIYPVKAGKIYIFICQCVLK